MIPQRKSDQSPPPREEKTNQNAVRFDDTAEVVEFIINDELCDNTSNNDTRRSSISDLDCQRDEHFNVVEFNVVEDGGNANPNGERRSLNTPTEEARCGSSINTDRWCRADDRTRSDTPPMIPLRLVVDQALSIIGE